MKKLKFGISFLDAYLNDLPESGIYFFSESKTNIRFSFFYNFLKYHLSSGKSCLYLTSFSLAYENEVVRKKILQLNNYDNLTILEIPTYLKQLVNNTKDLYKVINDLKIYIEKLNPAIILIENIELLLSDTNVSLDNTLFSLIMDSVSIRQVSMIIDISSLNDKNKMICQNFATAIFKFSLSKKNTNYLLKIEKGKNLRNKQSVTLSLDEDHDIIPPITRNTNFFTLHECKLIVMPKDSYEYDTMFTDIFNRQIPIIYYDNIDDLRLLHINKKYSIIFIPTNTSKINGWKALSLIRKEYPFTKVILTGSIYTPVHQKIRAIKMGADRFLEYPFNKEKIGDVVSSMYQNEERERFKFAQHKIYYMNENILKNYTSLTIINDSLFRMLKDYAYNMINDGMSMNLYKFYMYKDVSDVLDDFKKINNKLVFISYYYIEENPALLMIYSNVNDNEKKYIKSQLEFFLEDVNNYQIELDVADNITWEKGKESSKTNDKAHQKKVHTVNYPLDEADMDYISEWIYQYV